MFVERQERSRNKRLEVSQMKESRNYAYSTHTNYKTNTTNNSVNFNSKTLFNN
jgi:hypothetical protein